MWESFVNHAECYSCHQDVQLHPQSGVLGSWALKEIKCVAYGVTARGVRAGTVPRQSPAPDTGGWGELSPRTVT